ncbi:phosphodiester glycosidase family protein [Winogradskyella psychrotolerans]|uniref:phosphodiester glycosidase family protein n=1 Tax=Winogradskyella psychrotolerans TaxID=1344585 RepID=UPI001C064FB9|nr:phosphodiester glycosidase family protein [Winogradskyella psychrotolerans]MBU2927275.1 phosphodiester glycosidase family protein [Winogradskyella psychrotolerans]
MTDKKTTKISTILNELKNEKINTWFDLGLFMDKFKEKDLPSAFKGNASTFDTHIENGGIAFLTFYFTIDGITVETEKYAKTFKSIYPNIPIHFIAGEIKQEADELIPKDAFKKVIPEMEAFDAWPLYQDFFQIKMERGSEAYNNLIGKFWKEVLVLVEKLGNYIEENDISLLYLINVCSNPGNVSLALATVLISEYLGIPVINNNHDFYWEGGNREVEIKKKGLKKGPRDFFFHNAHVGEFFSIIETVYPWESRSWMNVNINRIQQDHLINVNGHNPANVALLGTAVDTKMHQMSKRDIIKAFMQVSTIFANKKDSITVHTAAHHTESKRSLKPILLGHKTIKNFDFVNNNIVFLQPTRVISRKSIELNFKLIKRLFSYDSFAEKFTTNPQLKLSLIVSGPIPHGQQNYYHDLKKDFTNFLKDLPKAFKSRVLLGFLFSEFDKNDFKKKHKKPLDIEQLFDVASLILLPSQTEGRGLPIIEAAACGTPIFCRQYEPREVYDEVIGRHLDESLRLNVLEFKGSKVPKKLAEKICDHVFYPQNRMVDVTHNRSVIKKRYSLEALEENMRYILQRMYYQLVSVSIENNPQVINLLKKYKKSVDFENEDLNAILNKKKRHYLPGYGRLSFMHYLKSLIDPSFFRVEEQLVKGRVMRYARTMENDIPDLVNTNLEVIHKYYNAIDDIFKYVDGEISIRHDHALAYRHRNKKSFAYQAFTYQEVTGLVNMIYTDVFKPEHLPDLTLAPQFFADWELALFQLTNSKYLGIDDRKILTKNLKKNVPKGYFPGRYIKHELEYFVLQPIRAQLNLTIEQELTSDILEANVDKLEKIYIFIHEARITKWFSSADIKEYLESGKEPELGLLYNAGVIQIVETKQWSEGVHFPQMGAKAIKILRDIKEADGFLITNGEYAAMMTDIIEIDHFHIGKVMYQMTAKIMGIPKGSGFIQFVPAGVRTTLAYPTPIQTAKDFDMVLKSELYQDLKDELGEKTLLNMMTEDAIENGTPIAKLLTQIKEDLKLSKTVEKVKSSFAGGVYDDGLPWSGVLAEIDTKKHQWKFAAHIANKEPKNVPALVKEYKKKSKNPNKIELAWNGGYILNPELVGKLGLPETYIGSPLGLLIMDNKVFCPPLFNKPAFIIYKNGDVDIRKVNSKAGLTVKGKTKDLTFSSAHYNTHSATEPCFYDLSFTEDTYKGNGNVIVRIAGNTVKEIIKTKPKEEVCVIPVGITLSIPEDLFSDAMFEEGKSLSIQLLEPEDNPYRWDEISYAIEAGPMLIDDGKQILNMEEEGWKTTNSIKTQAARLDFTDMRGPKIAVGITKAGKLMVLMVNGRIRESVGATHFDMVDILLKYGMDKAMGFDPGGSSTLVVDGNIMNISPYNKNYEKDIYALPPEPRFVANAIMGWIED